MLVASPQPRPPQQDLTEFSTHSYFAPPTPPPTKSHRPSISTAMNWLSTHKANNSITSLSSLRTRSRSTSFNQRDPNASQSQLPMRISEPYLLHDDMGTVRPIASNSRRPLGQGAEVIGTPAEALERAFSPTPVGKPSKLRGELPPIPQSPPSTLQLRPSKSSPHLKSPTRTSTVPSDFAPESPRRNNFPHGAAAKPPIVPIPPLTPFATPPLATSAQLPDHRSSSVSYVPPVPSLAPFEAVLVSSPSHSASFAKPSQTIVTLETCTETFRTTLGTLLSRPSALTVYLDSLREPEDSTRSGRSSLPASPFTRVFSQHLQSEGLHHQSQSASNDRIHVFLDRPSTPYAHILSYLRSPDGDLPRGVSLGDIHHSTSYDAMKFDALLELRDEAAYLGLKDLMDLCEAEAKRWFGVRTQSATPRPVKTPSPVNSRPNSYGSVRNRPTEQQQHVSKPRQLRHSPSASGLRPLAVPSSIHETETISSPEGPAGDESILETAAPWAELGMRASLDAVSDEMETRAGPIGPPPNRPLPEAPAPLPAQTAVGLKERAVTHARNRSQPSPRIPVRPTLAGHGSPGSTTSKHVRGNSFLPTLTSPKTPATASSGGNWI